MIRKRFNSALNNVSIWHKGIALISIPLLILVFTLILMAWHETVSRNSQARISQSLKIKASIYKVLALATDSETAVRGYLLWKDPAYLDPYNQAKTQLSQALQQLSELVKNNTDQSDAAARLRKHTLRKIESMRSMLNNPPPPDSKRDPDIIASLESMANIRSILNDMKATEELALNNRINEYDQLLKRINFSMGCLFLLAILGGMAASYVVTSSILKRINDLEDYARRVSRGQAAQWQDTGEDEVGMLGRSVGIMTTNLLAREESLRQARSELESANASLAQQLQETREANQELESFSYSVSHDLRAPLRHVSGFSELMLKNSDGLDEKNKRYLGIIASSIDKMGVLIDELLEFSRMGRSALKSDPVNLATITNEIVAELAPEICNRNTVWEIDPLPTVRGDHVMIRLVIQNLLGNAIKYTKGRDPAVIEIHSESIADGAMQKITIRDNGVGFDERYQDKLFNVFQRLHNSEEFEGTGIGLATVKRIIKRHGGDVTAAGEIDKFAEFAITLPSDISLKNENS